MSDKIGASVEVSPKHVHDQKFSADMFPNGTRIYVTDVGTDTLDYIVSAAQKITDMGFRCVPHIPARRIKSKDELEVRFKRLAEEAGVSDVLVIAGEAKNQMGPYEESIQILESEIVDKVGIKNVAVAGHPEGNDAYKNQTTMEVLKKKYEFSKKMDAEMRITTQFGFDGNLFVQWAEDIQKQKIELPIHLGVAGPAKITTLIKYAAMCGVGNSINFLKKRASHLTQIVAKQSPEEIVEPIELAWKQNNNVRSMHIFPFGGLETTAEWLYQRGTFSKKNQETKK